MAGRYFDNPAEDPAVAPVGEVEVITLSDDEPDNERRPEVSERNLPEIRAGDTSTTSGDCSITEVYQLIREKRPVVIDGSNVALEHGRPFNTFSVEGIKLTLDFFFNRGYFKVTAFVPKFRKSRNTSRRVPTIGYNLLEELERQQTVVLTPSRILNGNFISSDDARYVLQLAASNGGIIVSNRQFSEDLLNEDESYREAVEQRQFTFQFDGDFLSVIDPLHRSDREFLEATNFITKIRVS